MGWRQIQVAEARNRRSEQNIEAVFLKYAKDSGGISQADFFDSCQEVRFGLITAEDAGDVFRGLLLNANGVVELNEFRRIVNTRSPFEQFISRSIQFHELMSSALPQIIGKTSFELFRELTPEEISDISLAVCKELETILKETVLLMRERFEFAQPQQRSVLRFSVNELKAGNIEDYRKGLSGRIGDEKELRLIYIDGT